jgi:hypothetical protein
MPKYETIEEYVERRTYIKGDFQGKFIGHFDSMKSDSLHENFYDLEVIKGEIFTTKDKENIRHWESGEPEEFETVDKFITNLPEILLLNIKTSEGEIKSYNINLNEAKLSRFSLTNQVHEKDRVFGDIKGIISGYIKHYDTQLVQKEIQLTSRPLKRYPPSGKIKTNKRTGKSEFQGGYKRWEYYYADNSTYWGRWQKQSSANGDSIWDAIGAAIGILVFLAFAIPIVIVGWELILPILIIIGVFYLVSALIPLVIRFFDWSLRFLGVVLSLIILAGIISYMSNTLQSSLKTNQISDTEKRPLDQLDDESIPNDSIIVHHRTWRDYDANNYSGNIKIRYSDFKEAYQYRNNLSIPLQQVSQYDRIVSLIEDFDSNRLDLLYTMLDIIRYDNELDEIRFANVVVSLIQQIPYTLILNDACDADIYEDDFIRTHLQNGGSCVGNVKYGLLSPVEFMATLTGDCDTRTLLVFTILNHYGYDVAMLSSELFQHSIIAINLPYKGLSKQINGNRYVVWETTQEGMLPGVLSPDISDMRFWEPSLINNVSPSL